MPAAKKRLVLEHLEDISWEVLHSYPEVVKSLIRGKSGVYALYRRERLYYVGLATNLMGRLKQHLRDRHNGSWDRFSVYLTAHDDHMKELESLMLRINKPQGNKQNGKFVRSSNLRLPLNRKVTEEDKDRRAMLLGGPIARRRRRVKARNKKGTVALAGVVPRRVVLKASYKGWEYKASLLSTGQIRYDGVLYDSPTGAAKAIVGRPVSGWKFWKYKNSKREWAPLGDMRK